MKRVCFICLGNICRSPMAEYIFKDLVKKAGKQDEFYITSRATSYEEEGNLIHYGTREVLTKHNIPFSLSRATVIERSDYDKYDYFICMEEKNIRALINRLGGDKDNKISKLLEDKNVADPYFTGNFDLTFEDVSLGCKNLFEKLCKVE